MGWSNPIRNVLLSWCHPEKKKHPTTLHLANRDAWTVLCWEKPWRIWVCPGYPKNPLDELRFYGYPGIPICKYARMYGQQERFNGNLFCDAGPNGLVWSIPNCSCRIFFNSAPEFMALSGENDKNIYWLVVWTPLKNISQMGLYIIPNIWENKKCSKPPTRIYKDRWNIGFLVFRSTHHPLKWCGGQLVAIVKLCPTLIPSRTHHLLWSPRFKITR